MGLFKALACVAGGAVAIVAAPAVLAGAAVGSVGAVAIGGATLLGASVETAAVAGSIAAMGAVGTAGGLATKKGLDYLENQKERKEQDIYNRGIQDGRNGEASRNDALRLENESLKEQNADLSNQHEKDMELLKVQDDIIQEIINGQNGIVD